MEATASRFIRPTFTLTSRASNFRIPDYASGFILHANASVKGLGPVPLHYQENK